MEDIQYFRTYNTTNVSVTFLFPEQFMSVWSLKDHPKYFWTDAMAYL